MPRSIPKRTRIGTEILPTIQSIPTDVPMIRLRRWARSVVASNAHFERDDGSPELETV